MLIQQFTAAQLNLFIISWSSATRHRRALLRVRVGPQLTCAPLGRGTNRLLRVGPRSGPWRSDISERRSIGNLNSPSRRCHLFYAAEDRADASTDSGKSPQSLRAQSCVERLLVFGSSEGRGHTVSRAGRGAVAAPIATAPAEASAAGTYAPRCAQGAIRAAR